VRACRARTSSTRAPARRLPNAPPSSTGAAWRSTSQSRTQALPQLSATSWPSSRTNCACCHAANHLAQGEGATVVRLGLISQRVEPRAARRDRAGARREQGRFDRAAACATRGQGLPHRNSLTSDEFMAATLDVWRCSRTGTARGAPGPIPRRAPRAAHPALHLRDDLILDRHGSGSTLVAQPLERRYVATTSTRPTSPSPCSGGR